MPEQQLFGGKAKDTATQKILDEMSDEEKTKAQAAAESGEDDTATSDAPADDKKSAAQKGKPAKSDAGQDDIKDGDDTDDDDDEDEEGKEKGLKPEPRVPQMIPLSKLQKAKESWKQREEELTGEIETLKKSSQSSTPQIESIAKKHGLEPDLIKDLVEVIQGGVKTSAELEHTVQSLIQTQRDREQDRQFDSELAEYVKSVPEAATLKDKIHQLAFSETPITVDGRVFQSYQLPVRMLYEHLTKQKPIAKSSVEGGQGGRGRKASADKPISEMSDKEFEEYSNRKAKEQGGTLTTIKHHSQD